MTNGRGVSSILGWFCDVGGTILASRIVPGIEPMAVI
jgi:hypothetical protein